MLESYKLLHFLVRKSHVLDLQQSCNGEPELWGANSASDCDFEEINKGPAAPSITSRKAGKDSLNDRDLLRYI
jgi:hypothetical protein